ncbi:MAG: hypothetical protein KF729_39085 [Sandaracinaceae bacterium]|nr:hypothetical protein [Sandaracinaceae bacterium]
MDPDLTDAILVLLGDVLAASERVLARADPRDARLARVRDAVQQLDQALWAHWTDLAAADLHDDHQLHFDDLVARG